MMRRRNANRDGRKARRAAVFAALLGSTIMGCAAPQKTGPTSTFAVTVERDDGKGIEESRIAITRADCEREDLDDGVRVRAGNGTRESPYKVYPTRARDEECGMGMAKVNVPVALTYSTQASGQAEMKHIMFQLHLTASQLREYSRCQTAAELAAILKAVAMSHASQAGATIQGGQEEAMSYDRMNRFLEKVARLISKEDMQFKWYLERQTDYGEMLECVKERVHSKGAPQ